MSKYNRNNRDTHLRLDAVVGDNLDDLRCAGPEIADRRTAHSLSDRSILLLFDFGTQSLQPRGRPGHHAHVLFQLLVRLLKWLGKARSDIMTDVWVGHTY